MFTVKRQAPTYRKHNKDEKRKIQTPKYLFPLGVVYHGELGFFQQSDF